MKMQLRIVLLLALGVHSLHSAAIIAKRGLSSKQQDVLLTGINKYRYDFAVENKIGNMVELTYDKGLEKKADDMTNCKIKNGDYVVVSQTEMDGNEKLLYPLQSKIGCAQLPAACPERGMEKDEAFCLIGPHSSPPTDKDFKYGGIGAHCSNGPADSGLCNAADSSKKSIEPAERSERPSGGSSQRNRPEEAAADESTPTNKQGVFHSYSTLFFILSALISAYLC